MYISINQEFTKEEIANIAIKPWQIQLQGNVLSEHIRANAAKPLLTEIHYNIIKQNADILKFNLPKYFTIDFLKSQINGVLTRNKLFQAANVVLTIIRDINSNKCDIIIASEYAGTGLYEQNEKGLFIDIFNEAFITIHHPNQLDQHCQLINGLAKIAAKEKKLDDMLLLADQGFVVSATDSAFFAIQKGKILTPPLELGVKHDAMRDVIIKAAENINYQIDSDAFIMPEDLIDADEIFLGSTAKGLQWVSGFKNHRYIHKESKKLNDAVNNILFA